MMTASQPARERQSLFANGMAVIWAIALAKLLFHIYFNQRYGYFRDEFDYMSCGDHLAWGYVDQPPLIPFLIRVCRAVLMKNNRFHSHFLSNFVSLDYHKPFKISVEITRVKP